jgi:hypothetical protein
MNDANAPDRVTRRFLSHEGADGVIKKNPHWGTTLNEFLGAEGVREAAKAAAVTRLVAWQLIQEKNGASGHDQGDVGRKDAHQPRAGGPHPEG